MRTGTDGRIDWERAKKRLDEAAQALQETARPSPERARAVLEERARRLARRPEKSEAGSAAEALCFSVGPERYGIEAGYVREVVRASEVTPVPGGPDLFSGVTNLRGEVLAVADLRRLLGLPALPRSEPSRLLVLGVERAEFGVLADAAEEIVRLRAEEILRASPPPPSSHKWEEGQFVKGVTQDARVILDGEKLLRAGQGGGHD